MVRLHEMAKALAPEDIRLGQYLMELRVVLEIALLPCPGDAWQKVRRERVAFTPWCTGDPMRVKAVCLPFVRVTRSSGNEDTLDVRRHELAVVSDAFGDRIFARAKKARRKRRKRKRRKLAKGLL